jgi:hypothetical protein
MVKVKYIIKINSCIKHNGKVIIIIIYYNKFKYSKEAHIDLEPYANNLSPSMASSKNHNNPCKDSSFN